MEVVKNNFTFPSVTGFVNINSRSWVPDDSSTIKGVIQIAHGMAEHIDRYDDFATFLANNGYAVFANDHIGHGKSINNIDELGYFSEHNFAGEAFVDDCKQLQDIAVKQYPNLPYILFGHSMGSFIARKFTAKYGNTLTAVIYCGTAPKNAMAPIAIKLAERAVKTKGEFYRSEKINNLSFKGFNKKFDNRTAYDWISTRNDIVDKFIDDEKCGFIFTALGFRDLFTLLDSVSHTSWYESVPTSLPIFAIYGGMDPVGAYGKGVKKIVDKLRSTGHNVTDKLYPNCRHELLNETNNKEVYADVLEWIDNEIKPQ